MLAVCVGAGPVAAADGPFAAVRRDWAVARALASDDAAASLPLFDRVIAASPANNGLLLSAAEAALRAKDLHRLSRWLDQLARQGGAPSPADAARFSALLGRPVSGGIDSQAPPARITARRLATVPRSIPLVEGVAYDPRQRSILIASVVGRSIHRIDRSGRPRLLVSMPAGAGSPLGLAFDHERRVLWAALDPAAPGGGGDAHEGGLLRYEPATRKLATHTADRQRIGLGDVTVGPDGTAYGADPHTGAVYRCLPGCAALHTLIAPGLLRSAQGLATSADGRKLYVADYGYGVAVLDLATGSLRPLCAAPGIALDGIDGLMRQGRRLIAVQNGWPVPRVVVLVLNPAGSAVTRTRTILRAREPTQLTPLSPTQAAVVADAQWRVYEGASGGPAQRETPIVTVRTAERRPAPSPRPPSRKEGPR